MHGSPALSQPDTAAPLTVAKARKMIASSSEPRTLAQALSRISELEECAVLLFEALRCEHIVIPNEFNLTPSQERVLAMILSRPIARREQMLLAVYGFEDDTTPEIKILDVFVCKIRDRLTPFDVSIETKWGVGWYMTPEQKDRLRGLILHFGGRVDGH